MSFLGRLAKPFQRRTSNAVLHRLDEFAGLFSNEGSYSGVSVTRKNALQVATVFACVRVLSEGVASLPVRVVRLEGTTRVPELGHPVAVLLNKKPNAWQTGLEFRETLMMHAVLEGNGYAFKVRGARGQIVELLPLMPEQVSVQQMPDYELRYDVSDHKGALIGAFTQKDIMHLRGPSRDGFEGMSAVRVAQQAIGLSIATERSQAKLHSNGGRPGGLLSTDAKLQPDQLAKLRDAWDVAFKGSNQFKTAVLDAGFKFMPLAMSGVDSQHLETRRFEIEEVCRFFNVFPQMVMHADKTSTYASAEAFFSAHVRQTMQPWLKRCEQVYDNHLLDGVGPLETMHDTRELLKPSAADREKFYRTMAEIGVYTRNELRELEGLAPLAGLDEPLTPMNMTPGGTNDENPTP